MPTCNDPIHCRVEHTGYADINEAFSRFGFVDEVVCNDDYSVVVFAFWLAEGDGAALRQKLQSYESQTVQINGEDVHVSRLGERPKKSRVPGRPSIKKRRPLLAIKRRDSVDSLYS